MDKRVLVVDDNRLMRMMVIDAIGPLGCDVREAADGAGALQLIREFEPDLVILDVLMPNMSGFELLERLRDDERAPRCRVAILTTADSAEDLHEARALDADAYITKPFAAEDLRERVATLLGA